MAQRSSLATLQRMAITGRAVEFPPSRPDEAMLKVPNCDEEGDEMFHDVVDTMCSYQLDLDCIFGNVHRDCFRPLAKQYQGGGFSLHELAISPGRLHALVKLLLVAQFGPYDDLDLKQFPDLDRVTCCVVKAFHRIPDMDITWPMFDDAAREMPFLFTSLCHILSNFTAQPVPPCYIENLLPDPDETVLTFPILTQLCIILNGNICWKDFKLLCSYSSYDDPVKISTIIEKVTHIHEAVVLLFSGRITHTDEDTLFGAFIPEPCKDGNEIQERDEHRLDLLSCYLFQLSPVHDVSWGNVGRPGWSLTGNEFCFGEKDNGAALVLNNGMKAATLIWNVEQKDPTYTASAWRGKDAMQVEVKAIEIWGVFDEVS